MSSEPPSKSPTADLLLSALQELGEMKFEVTVSIKPPEDPDTDNSPDRPHPDITRTEELLPPILSASDIQQFLGIGENLVYELLNSDQFHVARVGRRMFVSRAVFLEWLEGRSDELEVKRRR